jgi:chromosome segregation ATPase
LGVIIPLVAAGLVIVLLAGWLVSMNGRLNSTKTALQAEQSHVTRLNGKVSSLSTQIDGLKGQKSTLETQVSSLNGALVDCKEAANTGLTAYNVFVKFFRGTASVYDLRTAVDEANRALSVCRTEARTNGAI